MTHTASNSPHSKPRRHAVRRRAAVVFLSACAVPGAAAARQDPADAEVRAIFAAYDRADAPGCAVGVSRAGTLVYAAGFGSANLDYGTPLTPRSVFYLASVSKQFTAAAVRMAAEEGQLSLDDGVRKYIPELPAYADPITIRHLVHHTSGLRDYLTLLALAGRSYDDALSDAALLDLIARQRAANFTAGSEHLYSNTGYVLLAEIVKRATGRTLAEYTQAKFFAPLGMRSTHFHDDAGIVVRDRVIGYTALQDSSFRVNHFFNFDKVGDGGLYSTVEDLAKWDGNFYEARAGSGEFVRSLHERGLLSSGDTLRYAFGLNIGSYRGLRTVEHGGALAGFRTNLLRFPDERFTAIVLCNHASANPALLARRVADRYLGGRMAAAEPVRPATPPGRNTETTAATSIDPATLAGRYHSAELAADYVLREDAGQLALHHPGGRVLALTASGADAFQSTTGLTLRFAADRRSFALDAGRVRGITFVRTGADPTR